jgi:flagellar export protein FliJ
MSKSNALKMMLKLASINEDRVLARTRKITAEITRSKESERQLQFYAREYGLRALESGSRGATAGELADTEAFRLKLQAGSEAQNELIGQLDQQRMQLRAPLAQARMRTTMLEKFIARQNRIEQQKQQIKEGREVEEGIVSRMHMQKQR